MADSKSADRLQQSSRLLIFTQFFAPALLLSILTLSGFFYFEHEEMLTEISTNQTSLVNSLGQSFLNEVAVVQADVSTLTHSRLFGDFIGGAENFLGPINNRFRDLSDARIIYEDIRLIAADGMEITHIRYWRAAAFAEILPPEELDDLSGESYFQRGMQLADNEIFLSDLQLDFVGGEFVEPIMHFAAPIFDADGNRFGVLAFSYDATDFIDRFKSFEQNPDHERWLLNKAGYWLSSSDPEDEWGFIYPDRQQRNLADRYPEIWLNLQDASQNTFIQDGDLYSYARVCGEVDCAFESQLSSAQSIQIPTLITESELIMVSRIPKSELGIVNLLRPHPERWALISGTILAIMLLTAFAAQRFTSIVVALRDKESELRQNSYLHEGFFEKNPSILFVKDLEGNYSLVNESFRKSTESENPEIVGSSYSDFVSNHVSDVIHEQDRQVIELRRPMEFETKINGAAGDQYFSILRFPLMDDEGEIFAVGGISNDRTDQIKARKALRESEEQFRSLVESAPDALLITNIRGKIVLVNKQAEKLFKLSRSKLLSKELAELLPDVELEKFIRTRSGNGEVSQIHQLTSMEAFDADGLTVPVDVAISTTETESGLTITCLIRDVSDRTKLEAQLRQSQKMDAIGKLTGGMAHDFNNLLGVIMGNIDLAQRKIDKGSAEYQRMVTAKKAATRGAELTKRMLAVARRQPLQPKPTNINSIILEMADILPRTLGPDIEMSYNVNEDIPDVLVDQSGLENVFLNLAINSRDAMPNGGKFYITTDVLHLTRDNALALQDDMEPGTYVQVSITDTGEGMTQETLGRVFEPFFTTKERGKGTGLGLAMIYGFVKQSEGNLRMYSEPGVGTTLDMFLPISEKKARKRVTEAIEAEDLTDRFSPLKVLVVDDEYDLLEVASTYLEDLGFKVVAATNGEQAMLSIDNNPDIDLLATDIVMPGGMNGTELSKMAKQKLPNIKVLYMSGFPSGVIEDKSGADLDAPLLIKPYTLHGLATALDSLLH